MAAWPDRFFVTWPLYGRTNASGVDPPTWINLARAFYVCLNCTRVTFLHVSSDDPHPSADQSQCERTTWIYLLILHRNRGQSPIYIYSIDATLLCSTTLTADAMDPAAVSALIEYLKHQRHYVDVSHLSSRACQTRTEADFD